MIEERDDGSVYFDRHSKNLQVGQINFGNESLYICNTNEYTNKLNFTPPPLSITFHDDNDGEVGRFFIEDGKLCFEGKADESAKHFIELVMDEFDNQVEEIVQKRLKA